MMTLRERGRLKEDKKDRRLERVREKGRGEGLGEGFPKWKWKESIDERRRLELLILF